MSDLSDTRVDRSEIGLSGSFPRMREETRLVSHRVTKSIEMQARRESSQVLVMLAHGKHTPLASEVPFSISPSSPSFFCTVSNGTVRCASASGMVNCANNVGRVQKQPCDELDVSL